MNHCWLIHLPLRAEAWSSGSCCDVWVSCSGSIPLWLFSSWLNPLSNGDVTSLCIPHRGTVRSDEFLPERVWNGMIGKSEKNISPHLKQHIWYLLFPLDQHRLQGFSGKAEVFGYWDFNCRPEEIILIYPFSNSDTEMT